MFLWVYPEFLGKSWRDFPFFIFLPVECDVSAIVTSSAREWEKSREKRGERRKNGGKWGKGGKWGRKTRKKQEKMGGKRLKRDANGNKLNFGIGILWYLGISRSPWFFGEF